MHQSFWLTYVAQELERQVHKEIVSPTAYYNFLTQVVTEGNEGLLKEDTLK